MKYHNVLTRPHTDVIGKYHSFYYLFFINTIPVLEVEKFF